MESIRKFANGRFLEQKFVNTPYQEYEFLTIAFPPEEASPSTSKRPPIINESSASLRVIETLATSSRPSLLLVTIRYDPPTPVHTFHARADDIRALANLTKVDECGLGLVANDTTGFHRVCSERYYSSSSDGKTRYRPATYYLYCGAYKLLWTYDARRGTTRALAFSISTARARKGYRDFKDSLSLQAAAVGTDDLAGHPLLIPLAGLAQTVSFTEKTLRAQHDKCRMAEHESGVHPWLVAKGAEAKGEAVRELAGLARQMTAAVTEVEMILRRVRQWKLGVIAYEDMHNAHVAASLMAGSTSSHSVEGQRSVTDALNLHKHKLEVMELDFVYLRERARNQATAITQLMTRDDTLASIDLARAAARDGASMKVVAIMTMAFLPGTFCAALFAVPSLRWEDDADTVIGRRFWVYWAFTLPLTVVVFAAWALLTQGEELAWLRKLSRRQNRSGGDAGKTSKEEEGVTGIEDAVVVVEDDRWPSYPSPPHQDPLLRPNPEKPDGSTKLRVVNHGSPAEGGWPSYPMPIDERIQ